MNLTEEQLVEFGDAGYLVVRDVVGRAFLDAADAEVDARIEAAPPPPGTVGKHFWFDAPAELPAAHAALRDSGALAVAEQLTAPEPLELILDHIQVALNIPPFALRPGGPHIDGHVQGPTQLTVPASFTLLAGVFLTDESEVDRGNLWVWPGSHRVHEQLFRDRGPSALMGSGGHVTMLDHPPPLTRPVPVLGRPGDLLLAHFLLGHNSGSNLGTQTRRMLYYRLGCPGHRDRWASTFTDAFTEFEPVRRAMPR